MSVNHSDYEKKRIDLFSLLPDVYHSHVNKSLFENLFNRYLTKKETEQVNGYVGEGNKDSVFRRRIHEPTVHRQSFQLQPVVYNKIGTVEWIYSWEDIQTKLKSIGIDVNKFNQLGKQKSFNWVPPIDIDKIIRYRDYYWVDNSSISTNPQYITIKSRCSSALSKFYFYDSLINEYGDTFPIIEKYDNNSLKVSGDYIELFKPTLVIFISNSTNSFINNTFYKILESSFNAEDNSTIIKLDGFSTEDEVDGIISLREQFYVFKANKDCLCSGNIGWDEFLWDDNPHEPSIWFNEDTLTNFDDLVNSLISGNISPTEGTLWFDTSTDTLKSYDINEVDNWKIIWNNFGIILEQVTGTNYWEYSYGCQVEVNKTAEQWITQNKWVHKSLLRNTTGIKRADYPIIEYDWDLELNEWNYIKYKWKYRNSIHDRWVSSSLEPTLLELVPIDEYIVNGNKIIIDRKYGNLSDYFNNNKALAIAGINDMFQISYSRYESTGSDINTIIYLSTDITAHPDYVSANDNPIIPSKTSNNDSWLGHDIHWLFDGIDYITPVNHQQITPFIADNVHEVIVDSLIPEYIFELPVSLRRKSLLGHDDVRVYVNDIRQYGNYDELSEIDAGIEYVNGIQFLNGYAPDRFDTVRIEVGESCLVDMYYSNIPVRTIEDNFQFNTQGTVNVSLIKFKKHEQVKTLTNQYPIFDIYDVFGNTTFKGNHIFGFHESLDVPVVIGIGKRIVYDKNINNFYYEQFLIDSDNSEMYLYKSFSNRTNNIWYNPKTKEIKFWDNFNWSYFVFNDNYPVYGISNVNEPENPLPFMVWYDESTDELKQYDGISSWTILTDYIISDSDSTLQSIWKSYNGEESMYIPSRVDWENRTKEEYYTEKELFIQNNLIQFLVEVNGDYNAAYEKAEDLWIDKESRAFNINWINEDVEFDGEWLGDWEIPDYLYYNSGHENKKIVNTRQLLKHFTTIIESQPNQYGFDGLKQSLFQLLDNNDINYALGGTIKEHNGFFDNFISGITNNSANPFDVIRFAGTQYELLLNTILESFRTFSNELLSNMNIDNILNMELFIPNELKTKHESNDYYSIIYGDSSTYNENASTGLRNWIATLPYIKLLSGCKPIELYDSKLGIDEIIHHDGHIHQYNISDSVLEIIKINLINNIDYRTPSNNRDTIGRLSNSLPPATTILFEDNFNSTINNRSGVYWLHNTPLKRTLYRLQAIVGGTIPSLVYPDGTLWLDLEFNYEVLRVKNGNSWDVVPGNIVGDKKLFNGSDVLTSTISAWKEVDLKELIYNTLTLIENTLYDNIEPNLLAYDIDALYLQYPNDVKDEERVQFLNYVKKTEIQNPFVNNIFSVNDPFTWNYKNSVNGNKYEIIQAEDNYFTVYDPLDNAEIIMPIGDIIYVKNASFNNGKYEVVDVEEISANIKKITINKNIAMDVGGVLYKATLPSTNFNNGSESASYWKALYNKFYNTQYPHLEPWKLQGYKDKPSWWDSEYKDDTNTRRWKSVMWDNIIDGIIPVGYAYPSGSFIPHDIPIYNYVSVNISNVTITGGYEPDDLLPPYYDDSLIADTRIRSIFNNYSNDIILPSSDYKFGDNSIHEWNWRISSDYLYSRMIIAMKIDPLNFFMNVFGYEYINVNGLFIEKHTKKVISHKDVIFHGDVVDGNLIKINGINQWYINYNRYSSIDIGVSDFYDQWSKWSTPLTYQFSSFLDIPTVSVSHKQVDITNYDYNITTKKSIGVEDYWLYSFNCNLIKIPRMVAGYNNQSEWELELNIPIVVDNDINYYDVKNYQCFVDNTTGIFTLYKYKINGIDAVNGRISIIGDHTDVFSNVVFFDIESNVNSGTYEISQVVYDTFTDSTILFVTDSLISDNSGYIIADYRKLPWETGDKISLSSTKNLPAPLIVDRLYFIIRLSDNTFKIAYNLQEAQNNIPMIIESEGTGIISVGSIASFFTAEGGVTNLTWKHYEIDKTNILTLRTPYTIKGMQKLVNIIDGYSHFINSHGWMLNVEQTMVDQFTGRVINWQSELEYFINWAYAQQKIKLDVPVNRYRFVVDDYTTNVFRFTEENLTVITGDEINLSSNNNILPLPLLSGIRYYVIRDSLETFRLASTVQDAKTGIEIDITEIPNTFEMSLYHSKDIGVTNLSKEINPFRTDVWFNTPYGIVSDISKGRSDYNGLQHLLFDQYGRQIDSEYIKIYRQDKLTHVSINDSIENDVDIHVGADILRDPKNFIHIGGIHLYVDSYEHVLKLNDYTTEGLLVYDPFIGVNLTKIELLFNRQINFTKRPNVGGFVISTNDSQQLRLTKNIENSIDDLRYLHDTNLIDEGHIFTKHARENLGYDGSTNYLNNLNINKKSQFLFWKGMIQNKGSVNTLKAFINSRRFIDAKVDEYWAVKISEYGSSYEKKYPEMLLTVDDSKTNDKWFEFLEPTQLPSDKFDGIYLNDTVRWNEWPEQIKLLKDNNSSLYFDMTPVGKYNIISDNAYYYNGIISYDGRQLYGGSIFNNNIIRHNFKCDATIVTFNSYPDGTKQTNTIVYNNEFIFDPDLNNKELFYYDALINEWVVYTQFYENEPITPIFGDVWFDEGTSNKNWYFWDSISWKTIFPLYIIENAKKDGYVVIPHTETIFEHDGIDWILNNTYIVDENEPLTPSIGDIWYDNALHEWYKWNGTIWDNIDVTELEKQSIIENNNYIISVNKQYIPNTGSLKVFVQRECDIIVDNDSCGKELIKDIDYQEVDGVTSNSLIINTELYENDILTILYVPGILKSKTFFSNERHHYENINSNIIRLLSTEYSVVDGMVIWALQSKNSALEPIRVIDKEAGVVVNSIQEWHPAIGLHYKQGLHSVDIISDYDVAKYNNTLIEYPVQSATDGNVAWQKNSNDIWAANKVGTVWFDTFMLDYIPYYDTQIYPKIKDRADNWGKPADWVLKNENGKFVTKIYKWVESDFLPEEYNAIAEVQENDKSIDDRVKVNGRVYPKLFIKDNDNWVILKEEKVEYDVIIDGIPRLSNEYIFQVPYSVEDNDLVSIYINGILNTDGISIQTANRKIISIDTTSADFVEGEEVEVYIDDVLIHDTNIGTTAILNNVPVPNNYLIDTSVPIIVTNKSLSEEQRLIPEKFNTFEGVVFDGLLDSIIDVTGIYDNGDEIIFWIDENVNGTIIVPPTLEIELTGSSQLNGIYSVRTMLQETSIEPPSSIFLDDVEIEISYLDINIYQGTVIALGNELLLQPEVLSVIEDENDYYFDVFIHNISKTTTETLYVVTSTITGIFGNGNYIIIPNLFIKDRVTLIKKLPSGDILEEEIENGNIIREYEYSTVQYYENDILINKYYFWVEDSTVGADNRIAPITLKNNFISIPTPYICYQKPNPAKKLDVNGTIVNIPYRYTQLLLRGLMGVISDNNRFILRFVRDFTLLEDLKHGNSSLDLKNTHEEWILIRPEQPFHIDKFLWDKITESIVGYKLSDNLIKVPSIDREFYDIEYDSDTSYGIGDDQIFVKRDNALSTIEYYLFNNIPDTDVVDLNIFFSQYSFDTNENIITAMNAIYNNFPYYHVNRMFFEVLHDAMTFKSKYKDIIKTSIVALHGIRPFETGGIFDD